jgi:hypothetical protein
MRRLTDQELLGCIVSAFMKGEAQKGAKRDRMEDQPRTKSDCGKVDGE